MQSPEWLIPWWQAHRNRCSRLQLLTLTTRSGQLAGLVPLYHHDSWSAGSSLRFLGSGQACSDYQTILCDEQHVSAACEATADWIYDNCNRGGWGYCEFDGVSSTDARMQQLVSCFESIGLLVQAKPIESCWRLPLTDDWKEVLSLQSKTQRRQSRNLLNRLDKSEALKVVEYHSEEASEESFAELMKLHQAHWENSGKPGCFACGRFTKFLRTAREQLNARDQWLIRTLYCNEIPAASQLLLLDGKRAYVYQSGREPTFDDQRVGRILNLDTARSLAERGFEFVDYLRGDEIYKARMGALPNELHRIRVVAPNARHQMTHASTEIGRRIKRSIKHIAQAAGFDLGS
jgi:CelD/BcsL family acetyltransferase involved in cellulose biosynthesis